MTIQISLLIGFSQVLQDVTNFEYLKGEFHDKYELLGNKNLCSSTGSQGSQEYREQKELQGRR